MIIKHCYKYLEKGTRFYIEEGYILNLETGEWENPGGKVFVKNSYLSRLISEEKLIYSAKPLTSVIYVETGYLDKYKAWADIKKGGYYYSGRFDESIINRRPYINEYFAWEINRNCR